MVTICRKDSDKFEGQSKESTGQFNLDNEFLKRNFYTLEPDFYKRIYEKDIEGLDMGHYKTFLVSFYYTKLNFLFATIQLKIKKQIASDEEEGPKNSES